MYRKQPNTAIILSSLYSFRRNLRSSFYNIYLAAGLYGIVVEPVLMVLWLN